MFLPAHLMRLPDQERGRARLQPASSRPGGGGRRSSIRLCTAATRRGRRWTSNCPTSYATNKEYQGINTLLLQSNYETPYWLTFRKAQKMGGAIRAGEKGSPIVLSEKAVAMEYESNSLQHQGYRAFPIPASKRAVVDERVAAIFSHKLAAHMAGLGWIGKSCLLITPQAGPCVRWATVLTDAPMQATGYAMAERCGECRECVEICPQAAFTGRPFREDEPAGGKI